MSFSLRFRVFVATDFGIRGAAQLDSRAGAPENS